MNKAVYWLATGVIGLLATASVFGADNAKDGESDIADSVETLDKYNVVWETPSKNSSGSMPIGNGDIGLNLWVEEGGDLLFYISKTDAWEDNSRLVKLGRVRVKLSPSPFEKGARFCQTLKLRQGEIDIIAGPKGFPITLRIRVDANHPVIYVEASCKRAFELSASCELWRTKQYTITNTQISDVFKNITGPDVYPTIVEPDVVVAASNNQVVWYHHNIKSPWTITMKLQGLESLLGRFSDPILHRTFGGLMRGDGLVSESDTSLKSDKPRRRFNLAVHILTRHPSSPQAWVEQIKKQAALNDAVGLDEARKAHRKWWDDFWKRSWIFISVSDLSSTPVAEDAEIITRAYTLQRWVAACAGRGAFPIKFNGSLFTVDYEGDPDFRRWGPGYWFQNTRLAYWPMLASGDFDLMQPFFRLYRNSLPIARERTRIHYGHEGAHWHETIAFWGIIANDVYGWNREGKAASYVESPYMKFYFSGALELITMMLDYYAHTLDSRFLTETLLPIATEVTTFYNKHYRRDASGKMRFEPAMSLETWHEATNPLPEIAGLGSVLERLLALPAETTTEQQRSGWQHLRKELPPLPTGEVKGKKVLLPAEQYSKLTNVENPELYAVFPYRVFGVGRPDLELARNTFAARRNRLNMGWCQDSIQAAYLGLSLEAGQMVTARARNKHADSRFPAFWGPNFDWVPDQDHGSNILSTVQSMLLQADGEKILLLPGWPKDWNVEFKLHAPMKTTVEGLYRDGKLQRLKVTPQSRRKDVKVMEPR